HEQAHEPIEVEQMTRHMELASQPLLLLMLALYSASGKVLTGVNDRPLTQGEFYEELLGDFVEREVRRRQPELDDRGTRASVEQELDLLAIAAFGMFNRGGQSVTG